MEEDYSDIVAIEVSGIEDGFYYGDYQLRAEDEVLRLNPDTRIIDSMDRIIIQGKIESRYINLDSISKNMIINYFTKEDLISL